MLQCMDQTAARISDAASVSEHSASEATTLCEIDIQPDANTPCKSVTHKPEVSNYLASLETNNKERYNPFVIDNKYTTNSRRKPLKWVWSSISNWFADYRTWRRVWATCSQIELWRKYYPVNAQELQEAYEYWRALGHARPRKFGFIALELRLRILDFWFNVSETPVYFSEQRKLFLRNLWLDLDYESSGVHPSNKTMAHISDLKHDVFLKVLDELPLKHSISDIIPGGPSVVEILCGELAYGSGAYAIQTTLRQISRTEWGHRELVRLAVRPPSEENRYKNLIVDCVTKLLSFENGFSCAMAFRIFGRLACCNQEVYILLGGSKGVAWLVRCLDEQTFGYHNRVGGAGNKKIEIYCNALMAACTQGFVDCVIQHNIVPLLLRVMEMFTERDKVMHSKIADNLQEDLDVEIDQIACCELIILLLKNSVGKKLFLEGRHILETFMKDPNRSFSDWKLNWKLTAIKRLLQDV